MKPRPDATETTRTMRRFFPAAFVLAVAVALALATWGAADGTSATTAATSTTAATQATSTKIRIRIGRRTLTATVARNTTARDFLSLLPLLDHDTDSYYKISSALSTGSPRAISLGTQSSTTSRCIG
jgi:hypothetical protein